MEVYCNKCNEDFSIDLKVKKWSRGIEETYFICPNCKKRYTSYFTDGSIRRKQGQIRDLEQQKQIKTRQLIDEDRVEEIPEMIDSINNDIEKIKQQIGEEMDKLKEKRS